MKFTIALSVYRRENILITITGAFILATIYQSHTEQANFRTDGGISTQEIAWLVNVQKRHLDV